MWRKIGDYVFWIVLIVIGLGILYYLYNRFVHIDNQITNISKTQQSLQAQFVHGVISDAKNRKSLFDDDREPCPVNIRLKPGQYSETDMTSDLCSNDEMNVCHYDGCSFQNNKHFFEMSPFSEMNPFKAGEKEQVYPVEDEGVLLESIEDHLNPDYDNIDTNTDVDLSGDDAREPKVRAHIEVHTPDLVETHMPDTEAQTPDLVEECDMIESHTPEIELSTNIVEDQDTFVSTTDAVMSPTDVDVSSADVSSDVTSNVEVETTSTSKELANDMGADQLNQTGSNSTYESPHMEDLIVTESANNVSKRRKPAKNPRTKRTKATQENTMTPRDEMSIDLSEVAFKPIPKKIVIKKKLPQDVGSMLSIELEKGSIQAEIEQTCDDNSMQVLYEAPKPKPKPIIAKKINL